MEGAGDDAGVAGEGGDVGAGRVRPIRQAADDPGWPHYADTVIEFRRRGRVVHLDCRVPMTDEARRHLAAVGLPGPFVVVTACNPGGDGDGDGDGDGATDAVDRRRTARLARRIRAAGRRPVRADGGSPDRTHVEPGWAADLPPATARRFAADAGQSAIFRFDGRRLWIEPVLVDAEPLPLPLPRPQSQSPEPPPLPSPPPPRPS